MALATLLPAIPSPISTTPLAFPLTAPPKATLTVALPRSTFTTTTCTCSTTTSSRPMAASTMSASSTTAASTPPKVATVLNRSLAGLSISTATCFTTSLLALPSSFLPSLLASSCGTTPSLVSISSATLLPTCTSATIYFSAVTPQAAASLRWPIPPPTIPLTTTATAPTEGSRSSTATSDPSPDRTCTNQKRKTGRS